MDFRPAAVPLLTVDPYFSIWSAADRLGDDCPRHWTGRPASIYLAVELDGKRYPICAFDRNHVKRAQGVERMVQTGLRITPLTTAYTFENDLAHLEVTFVSPMLPEHPEIFSRPVSYVEYALTRKDGRADGAALWFGVSAEVCVNHAQERVVFERTGVSLRCGNAEQRPLSESGDSVLINWGYLHLCDPQAAPMTIEPDRELECGVPVAAYAENPYLMTRRTGACGVIAVAYDEVEAIEYFGTRVKEAYHGQYAGFEEMVRAAMADYPQVRALCDEFDERLTREAMAVGEDYCRIVTLALRQAMAAHKLIRDEQGELVLLSKECHSNGCIGTLDVTYPSIPLFLKYNPELVLAMLRPILRYARSEAWPFEFAPHDVGQYPLANGQVYGSNERDMQMPVEESGNMLLCVAAACRFAQDDAFFARNRELLRQWADYLVENGYDPGNQLCTDDFAGHLSHNCNLSVKAILGIAAYGDLSGEQQYMDIAAEYAKRWERDAASAEGTRLVFDREEGWSLKYNMVWDDLLGYRLFSDGVKQREVALYCSKMERYGVPLDSRAAYTKLDWLLWSTCLWPDEEYTAQVTRAIVRMLCETEDRVPMTDWYDTRNALHHFFQHRSVVGGAFINLLKK